MYCRAESRTLLLINAGKWIKVQFSDCHLSNRIWALPSPWVSDSVVPGSEFVFLLNFYVLLRLVQSPQFENHSSSTCFLPFFINQWSPFSCEISFCYRNKMRHNAVVRSWGPWAAHLPSLIASVAWKEPGFHGTVLTGLVYLQNWRLST